MPQETSVKKIKIKERKPLLTSPYVDIKTSSQAMPEKYLGSELPEKSVVPVPVGNMTVAPKFTLPSPASQLETLLESQQSMSLPGAVCTQKYKFSCNKDENNRASGCTNNDRIFKTPDKCNNTAALPVWMQESPGDMDLSLSLTPYDRHNNTEQETGSKHTMRTIGVESPEILTTQVNRRQIFSSESKCYVGEWVKDTGKNTISEISCSIQDDTFDPGDDLTCNLQQEFFKSNKTDSDKENSTGNSKWEMFEEEDIPEETNCQVQQKHFKHRFEPVHNRVNRSFQAPRPAKSDFQMANLHTSKNRRKFVTPVIHNSKNMIGTGVASVRNT